MLSQRQVKALECLLTHPSKQAAAKAAHISPRTLSGYLQNPEFQQAYRTAITELIGDATRQSQVALSPALSTLQSIMEDELEPTSSRIQAAKYLLDFGLRISEYHDVLLELRELERGL